MKKKRTILIIDDKGINRKILGNILSRDYCVLEAENGLDALFLLEKMVGRISIILLDLVMPIMNGLEFMDELHKRPLIANIPVIVMTQKAGVETEIEVLSRGAVDFLPKPYNALVIEHRVANTIKMIESAAIVNTLEHDNLTGLFNKEAFYQKISEALEHSEDGEEFDIVCMDLNNFKLINDMYGEKRGDELLVYCAELIKEESPKVQGISSKIDGDVFMCFLPRIYNNIEEIAKTTREYLEKFAENFNVTMRFGIFKINDKTMPVRGMCDRAKLAVQSIKGKYDKTYAYYDDEIRNRMLYEQAISNEMASSLKREEFKVYFQPKCNLENKKIVGAEALVRWNHPTMGFLSPDEFIPFFEKNGFITDLDKFVWDKTCEALRQWMDMGYVQIPISVNVSRVDIYNPHLTDILCGLISKYNLPSELLHLEITETAYTENPLQLINVVSNLKKKGFILEMDDFGSGYSSLNMLNDVPVDTLKLDMRFLQNKGGINRNEDIVAFIIHLAQQLNLSVIAEGVENKSDLDFLIDVGCQYGQGYYFSKPMAKSDFEIMLHSLKPYDAETTHGLKVTSYDTAWDSEVYSKELRANLKNIPGGIFNYRARDGHMLFASENLYRMMGYTREEFAEKFDNNFQNLVYKEDRERVFKEINQQISVGDVDFCEYRVETKSGELRWFYDVGRIITDKNGEQYFFVIVIDNTLVMNSRKKLGGSGVGKIADI